MPLTIVHQVWEEMHQRIGNDLRVVTGFDGLDYETKMRDDVRTRYSTCEDYEVVDRMIVDQFSEKKIQESFKTGELHGTVRVFDECWVVTWFDPEDWKAGVLVSIERDGRQATIEDVESCLEYLKSDIKPRMQTAV